MTKAKLVFESESTFLSFPVHSPLSYPPDRLKFGTGDALTPQDWWTCRNSPGSRTRSPGVYRHPWRRGNTSGRSIRRCWKRTTLRGCILSTEEKARYDRAMAFLYTQSAEGLRQPSAALTVYSQYRDAHIKAQEEYKNRQFTAESSDDPAVQAQWRDVDEPRLRQEVQRLEQEWLTQGFRAQVEEAQQVVQACEARAPSRDLGRMAEVVHPRSRHVYGY